MRISAKTRYGLAAVMRMAESANLSECVTVISMAQRLHISKIYLEQVFALLKRGGVVHSIQGAQGGYLLTRPPEEITVYQVLSALESSMFEKAAETVAESDKSIEDAMQSQVFNVMDEVLKTTLSDITIRSLAEGAAKLREDCGYMYFL